MHEINEEGKTQAEKAQGEGFAEANLVSRGM